MISREDLPEIQKVYTDTCPQMEAVTAWEHELIVTKIYDSIGSCKECEYAKKPRPNAEFIYCMELDSELDDKFFCAKFKRKES